MAPRLKVAHIITRLELGGAQQNTLYCCSRHDRKKFDVLLISGVGGYLYPEAKKIKNCKTYFLPSLKHPIRPWWDLRVLFEITAILKNEKIILVQAADQGLLVLRNRDRQADLENLCCTRVIDRSRRRRLSNGRERKNKKQKKELERNKNKRSLHKLPR